MIHIQPVQPNESHQESPEVKLIPADRARIAERLGEAFAAKVEDDLQTAVRQWSLSAIQMIPVSSANLLFRCRSPHYGEAVLKIGCFTLPEAAAEYYALQHFNDRHEKSPFCKVYEGDPGKGMLLEEFVRPGTPLRQEAELDARLEVFCSIYRNLHGETAFPPSAAVKSPAGSGRQSFDLQSPDRQGFNRQSFDLQSLDQQGFNLQSFPAYRQWVRRITAYMSGREDGRELFGHMERADEMCEQLSVTYARSMLLHGDLHHDNILLGQNGAYVLIDPKGVVGDPVFDLPRFILNEFEDELTSELLQKIAYIICFFADRLQIPEEVIKRCLYVETTMAMCWFVEGGAAAEQMPRLLDKIHFVQQLLANDGLNLP